MKARILILIVFTISISACVAQVTTFNTEYFKLIRTYKTIDEVYQVHLELKPEESRIVIEGDEVVFYDENGYRIKKIQRIVDKEIPTDDKNYEEFHDNYKITSYFRLIEKKMLLVMEYYSNELRPRFKTSKLYNNNGIFLTNISEDTDIKVSPNGLSFATRYEGEAGMGLVQIFDSTGKEICTNKNTTELGIKYDRNNNLIINGFYDFTIIVKDQTCNDIVTVNTYKELHIGEISSIFINEGSDKFLISVSKTGIYYYNKNNNALIWNNEVKAVVEQCVFKTRKNLIYCQTGKAFVANKPKDKQLIVLDSRSGQVIQDISVDKTLLFDENQIIIKKGGRYYEYKI